MHWWKSGRLMQPAAMRTRPIRARCRTCASKGFGRAPTDSAGRYCLHTIKPGAVPGPNGKMQAPHIAVNLFARGILKQMVTRIYFSDEAANSSDPILALVPEDRRATLIARREDGGSQAVYRFDFQMQGEDETVFFEA